MRDSCHVFCQDRARKHALEVLRYVSVVVAVMVVVVVMAVGRSLNSRLYVRQTFELEAQAAHVKGTLCTRAARCTAAYDI